MSFTTEIKRELLSRKNESSCCEYAMLSAYLHGALSVVKNSSGYGFEVQTDSDFLANYCIKTIERLFGEEVGYYAVKTDKLQGRERFIMKYSGGRCREILQELGFLSKGEESVLLSGISAYLLENDCCRRAYVKGAFLGVGMATMPEKEVTRSKATGYHLQFTFSKYEYASSFCRLLAEFDFSPKLIERKNGFVIYFKNSQTISDLLAFMGANKSVLRLQDRLVEKSFQNDLNRKVNCEMGNMTKQVNAFVAQKIAITALDELMGINNLPEGLPEVCRARLNYPDESMSGLAEKIGISKSCLNHRLRKVMAIYTEISTEDS